MIFSPCSLSVYTLDNRIVVTSPCRMRSQLGVPTPMMTTYYAQRADAGLIVSEPTLVSPTTAEYDTCPSIYNYEQIEAWRNVTKAVHKKGGKIFLQLWHGEGIAPQILEQKHYDKIDSCYDDRVKLTKIIQQLRRGAQNALAADFDGVEINAAFGYILDTLMPLAHFKDAEVARNERERRIELLTDLVDAIASVWDYERVGVKICPSNLFCGSNDSDPESSFYYLIDALNVFQLAYLHLSEPPKGKSFLTIPCDKLTDLFRPIYKRTLIIEGDEDIEGAIATVNHRDADLISFGRTAIANPDLPSRLKQNAPLNQVDPQTIYGGDERGYTDYPCI